MGIGLASVEELLSVAYVSAVVAQAKAPCHIIPRDYGIDLSIRRIVEKNGKQIDMGVAFECQIKASTKHQTVGRNVVWDMEAEDYNKLVAQSNEATTDVLLVLMCLPKDPTQWLSLSNKALTLRKCCYWKADFSDITPNSSTTRLRIPLLQRFTPDFVAMRVSQATRKLV